MLKFNRTYSMLIETVDGETINITDPITLEFQVVRQNLASANTGSFRIYNLGEVTRRKIYKDSVIQVFRAIELRAGYGASAPLIFRGNVREALSGREEGSTEIVTEIDAFDGGFGMVNAFSTWTMNGPVSKGLVINRLAQDMASQGRGLAIGALGTFLKPDNTPLIYARGRSVCGPTWQLIQDEAGPGNAFIDNGRIYCMKIDDFIAGDILVVKSDTGLLGSPKRGDKTLIVEILFEPRLLVGQQIELLSNTNALYNGLYRVTGIQHTGVISGAVGGKCKTVVTLWTGDQNFETLLQNRSPFSAVA